MPRTILFIAAIGGLLSVALGAFGAHALEAHLSAKQLSTYQTAVQYQTIHSLALFGIGLLGLYAPSRLLSFSGWIMIAGICLFSGSLYMLVATGIKAIAMVTPVGGVCLMLGWLLLAIATLKLNQRNYD